MDPVVVTRPHPGIALVEMNDVERYNALSTPMVRGLHGALGELRTDREVRAIVLAGRGRGFCGGANMGGGEEAPPLSVDRGPVGFIHFMQEHLAELMLRIHEQPQPVIAAVHGAAVGGGLALTLGSGRRVAAPGGFFASRFIRVGLSSCDVGTSYFLPRI